LEFVTIHINTTGRVLDQIIVKKMKRFDRMSRRAMNAFGNKLVEEIRISKNIAEIKDNTNKLRNSIRWHNPNKEKSNYGKVVMIYYGIMLDRMTEHDLWITRNFPKRLSWAKKARSGIIQRLARDVDKGRLDKFKIRVRKHPFIKAGYRKARRQLPNIMKTYMAQKA
jgi:hypothetical protein